MLQIYNRTRYLNINVIMNFQNYIINSQNYR